MAVSHQYVAQSKLKHQLWVNGEFYGYWDGGDLESGSEVSDVVDPEFGPGTTGGRQTGGDLELSRPWRYGRERAVYSALYALRGRAEVDVGLVEFDEFDQPVGNAAFAVFKGRLVSVTKPETSAEGDAGVRLSLTVRIHP